MLGNNLLGTFCLQYPLMARGWLGPASDLVLPCMLLDCFEMQTRSPCTGTNMPLPVSDAAVAYRCRCIKLPQQICFPEIREEDGRASVRWLAGQVLWAVCLCLPARTPHDDLGVMHALACRCLPA